MFITICLHIQMSFMLRYYDVMCGRALFVTSHIKGKAHPDLQSHKGNESGTTERGDVLLL